MWLDEKGSSNVALTGDAALAILFEQLRAYLGQRADGADMENLSFSLRHLFACVDALYLAGLPELSARAACSVDDLLPRELLEYRYHIWTCLQDMKRQLARIEPLCRLIEGAASNLLDALDTTSNLPVIPGEQSSEAWIDQLSSHGHWEQAFTIVSERLNDWQQDHGQRLSFTIQFAEYLPLTPSLTRVDLAFDFLLDYACAVFGDILPDFRHLLSGQDATLASLLLDLAQKADLLLLHAEAILEPMQSLVRYYGAASGVYHDLNRHQKVLTGM